MSISLDSLQQLLRHTSRKDQNDELIKMKRKELLKYKNICTSIANSNQQKNKLQFALKIIRLFPEDRLEEENYVLIKATADMRFFQELNSKPTNVQMKLHEQVNHPLYSNIKCCAKMSYSKVHKGQVVFFQGELPEKFYILLSGQVNVMIQKSQNDLQNDINNETDKLTSLTEKEKEKKLFTILSKLQLQLNQDNQDFHHEFQSMSRDHQAWNEITKAFGGISLDQISNLSHFVYYGVPKCTYVVTLKEGDMFGDLGLLLEKPRAATIICKEDCELATLTAKDYKEILQAANTMKINNKVDFFQRTMLRACPKETVLKLSYNFVKKNVARNTILYRQNDTADAIYLIKSGTIQLSTTVVKPNEFEDLNKKYTLLDQESIMNYLNKNQMTQKKGNLQIPVSQCTQGQTFGDYELIFKKSRISTATCISEKASLYCLPKHIFDSIVHENRFVLNDLKQIAITKQQLFEKQIQNYIKNQLKYKEIIFNPTKPNFQKKEAYDQHLPQGPWKEVCQTSQQLLGLQQTIGCLSKSDRFYKQFAIPTDQQENQNLNHLTSNLKTICIESSYDIYKTIKQIDQDKKEEKKFFKNKLIDYSQYLAPLKKAQSIKSFDKVESQSPSSAMPIHSSNYKKRKENEFFRKKINTFQTNQDCITPLQLKTCESEPLQDFFISRKFDIENQPVNRASLCSYELLISDQSKNEYTGSFIPEDKKSLIRKFCKSFDLNIDKRQEKQPIQPSTSKSSRGVLMQSKHNFFRSKPKNRNQVLKSQM